MNKLGKLGFLILCCSIALLGMKAASAKAYHPSMRELIQQSTYIAIVTIGDARASQAKGVSFKYFEESNAETVENIKRKLPKTFTVYGQESFICARCKFTPGKALVFLRQDADLLVGQGWGLSCLPIKDGKVQWPSSLDDRVADKSVDLKVALGQIREIMRINQAESATKDN